MRARVAVNPDLQSQQRKCPGRKQTNLKSGSNNHLKCWNCKSNFCFVCNQRIMKNVAHHFKGPCQQHSWTVPNTGSLSLPTMLIVHLQVKFFSCKILYVWFYCHEFVRMYEKNGRCFKNWYMALRTVKWPKVMSFWQF